MKFILAVAMMGLIITSCKQQAYKKFTANPILFCKTVKQLNDVVLENNFPPMIASRNYVYANIAAYEVMVLGDDRFQSLAGQIKHLPAFPGIDTAGSDLNYAALLAFCKAGEAVTFPEGSMKNYVDQLDSMASAAHMSNAMKKASRMVADSVANHILRWSKKDNYLQLRTATKFTVTEEEGRWVPTPPMYAQAMEPHWMEMRPMMMDSASQFKPAAPPVYDVKDKNSGYYRYLTEVKNIGDSLKDEQKHIAEFWDDNPFKMNVTGHVMFATKKFSPPGHWMNIVGIGAQKAGADFSTTIAAYAETSIALYDAFISCWDEKYRSNTIRPESYINAYIDESWRPLLQTPPFPEYTSGHSVISSSAAVVLATLFGNDFSFADDTEIGYGLPVRHFTSFLEAAEEAAISRFYGGIHYKEAITNGMLQGRKIGDAVVEQMVKRLHKDSTTGN